jgi:magnesium chelatase family protein
MEIYGADLRGIDGTLIRFRVLGQQGAQGVTLLGNARRATTQGTIERCLNAIHVLEGFEHVGDSMRYIIDLSPPNTSVQSPGIDLPLAITILRATVMQSRDEAREEISKQEAQIKSLDESLAKEKGNFEKRQALKKLYLQHLDALRKNLSIAESYQNQIARNTTKYLLIGKLDITTAAIESPKEGMLGLIAAATADLPMTVFVPEDAEVHASIVAAANKGLTAIKARDLSEVWGVITGQCSARACRTSRAAIKPKTLRERSDAYDLKDIEGNSRAKLALELALAGRHSLLFVGPAGQGKSMLAKAATKLLPELEAHELLEVNKIYSARGELEANELLLERPFQEVSSTITEAALFGGGGNGNTTLRPGLISAAHRGILFFDEVNRASSAVLDQLRIPWQEGRQSIQRANVTLTFPARFQFIGAMNPCKCSKRFLAKCGNCKSILFADQLCPDHPKALKRSECTCTNAEVHQYLGRLSGPIKDRVDMVCLVSRYDQDNSWRDDQSSRTVGSRIKQAWERQRRRYRNTPHIHCNGDARSAIDLYKLEAISKESARTLEGYLSNNCQIDVQSFRKRDQLLCLARTVADLEDSPQVDLSHIKKAVTVSGLQQGLLT